MTDEEMLAELQRRQDQDTGIRHSFDDALRLTGITREELTDEQAEEAE